MREQNGRVLSRTAVHFMCNPHLHSVFTLKIPHLSFRDILNDSLFGFHRTEANKVYAWNLMFSFIPLRSLGGSQNMICVGAS